MSEVANQTRWRRLSAGSASALTVFSSIVVFCNVAASQPNRPKTPGGPVCPLSDEQTRASIEAFAKIASFMTHEKRCVNCHGGVNPHIAGIGPDPDDPDAPPSLEEHGGGGRPREYNEKTGERLIPIGCKDCHNNMAPKRDGSPSRWMTAPNILAFVGKDATALCKQIRRQSGDAEEFMNHLYDDNGGDNFAGTAFKGDRGLDHETREQYDVLIEKPSISHADLLKLGQNWIDAMGGEFKGDTECGCVPTHYAIRLTTHVETRIGPSFSTGGMKVDIPITFANDGSFTGQGVANGQSAGRIVVCQGQSTGNVVVKASGSAIETPEKHSMHLQLDEGSPVKITAGVTCLGSSASGTTSQWGRQIPPFDLKGLVGEAIDKPFTQIPGMISNMHLEIMKRQP